MDALLDSRRRKHLLAIARGAIAQCIGPPTPVLYQPRVDPGVAHPPGAFVTLTKSGRLRGCVGQLEPSESLEATIASCAVAAATTDPRFPPLAPEELRHVIIEISILTPPISVAGPGEIVVGMHGVIVRKDTQRGLLLPQVGADRTWTAETLLEQAALKAGLPEDAWRAGASIEVFTAEVFSEADGSAPHTS